MKPSLRRALGWAVVVAACVACGAASQGLAGEAAKEGIDWNRARELYQRSRRGEALTPEESAYLERAKAAKGKEGRPKGPMPQVPPARPSTGLVPLDQMTAQDKYKGEDGGLYGGGRNAPPEEHLKAALAEAANTRPLDAQGKPAPGGKIVLLSIGMSNTTQEFSKFKELADKDPARSPQVVIVDGAQGGQDAARWSTNDARAWTVAEERLRAAGVTVQQVQAVWMKHARIGPAQYGEFPKHVEELKGHVLASLSIARERYPNLRVTFLSSRIYAGYAVTPLNPEPYAYESAFAVRGLIQDQIKGEAKLNWDAAKGPVKAPLLLWGPYLWGDGVTPRKSDGLVWQREDLGGDGTHPSGSGREKVARLLLGFFKSDPSAKGWFVRPPADAPAR
ncbi:MAG TPA: hypothetical protein VNE39_25460 [Planctomycetota bacterium]|nr:hypothetical protein [Planctomycetota bacterium]